MASKHLDEPLDYLYEELPPERMAEARRHLAECPQCREEMTEIRELVKVYRTSDAPRPPAGLAARTAAVALAEATAEAERRRMAAEAPPPVSGEVGFQELRDEVATEVKSGRKRLIFHPAWTVAASVLVLCALLIHFSPRREYGEELQRAATPVIPYQESAAERDMQPSADRPRLPAVEKRAELPRPSPVPPPTQSEAKVWEEPAAIPARANTAEPSTGSSYRATVDAGVKLHDQFSVPAASPEPLSDAVDERAAAPRLQRSDAAGGGSAPKPPVPPVIADAPAGEQGAGPEILGFPNLSEPPQLIERPTPIDTDKLVRDLTFLAGLQIGEGEFADAWITIGMLRKYDAVKADELTTILTAMENRAVDAQESEATAPAASTGSSEAEMAPDPVEDDQPATVEGTAPVSEAGVPEPNPLAEGEGVSARTEVEHTVDLTESYPPGTLVDKYLVTAQIGQDTDATEPAETAPPHFLGSDPATSDVSPDASPAVVSEAFMPLEGTVVPSNPSFTVTEDTDYYVGPVYSSYDTPPAIPDTFSLNRSGTADGAVAVTAPDVPKSSPSALPPTLGECSGMDVGQSRHPGIFQFRRSGSARPHLPVFSTDPYLREP